MSSQAGWELDAGHREFQAVCRAFTDRHVRPAAGEAEALGRMPESLWKELGGSRATRTADSRGTGRQRRRSAGVALLAEELARASGGIAVSALASAYMAAPRIVNYGSAAQRAAYLPRPGPGAACNDRRH